MPKTLKKLTCDHCKHKHIIINDNPDGLSSPLITCGKCKLTWISGKDAMPYAASKFAEDRRGKK